MFREEQSKERELRPVSIDEIHKLFHRKHDWASLQDYLEAKNSIGLKIFRTDSGLYIINHVFKKEEVEVPTPKETLIRYGTTGLQGFPGKDFAVALLWQFHGDPCERRSRSIGGEGYTRR